jgi:hypothetical protein
MHIDRSHAMNRLAAHALASGAKSTRATASRGDAVQLSAAARAHLDASPSRVRGAIRSVLTPSMLRGEYKKMWTSDKPKSWGHCYTASEAYYHMMGGKAAGLKPYWVKHEGTTHHFLRDARGKVVDLTGDQFKSTPPYDRGTPFGWLTGETPSKRAQVIIDLARERL